MCSSVDLSLSHTCTKAQSLVLASSEFSSFMGSRKHQGLQEGSSEMRGIKVWTIQDCCRISAVSRDCSAHAKLPGKVETSRTLVAIFHSPPHPLLSCSPSEFCPKGINHPLTSTTTTVIPQFLTELCVYIFIWGFLIAFQLEESRFIDAVELGNLMPDCSKWYNRFNLMMVWLKFEYPHALIPPSWVEKVSIMRHSAYIYDQCKFELRCSIEW